MLTMDRRAFLLGSTALAVMPAFGKSVHKDPNRWTVGDIVVHRIVQVEEFAAPAQGLYQNITAADVLSVPWVRPNYATEKGDLRMSFHAFLVRTPDKTILVDTCFGDRKLSAPMFSNLGQAFLDNLAKLGVAPEDIDIVMCTHMHYDHVGWNTRLQEGKWVPTFPKARHLFSTAEYEATKRNWKAGEAESSQFADTIVPVVDAGLADFIDPDAYQVCEGVRLLSTPGHSAGHYSVELISKKRRGVITGDLIHNPVHLAFPDRYTRNDADKPLASKTRQRFFERFGDGKTIVFGSHFTAPTAGHIVRSGAAWRFDPLR